MKGYILSPAAQRDLNDIWDYSAERWSPSQANRYVEAIQDACQKLGAGNRRGRQIDDVRPGYWKFAVKSHFLLYRVTGDDTVDVVRILHQRMDTAAHL